MAKEIKATEKNKKCAEPKVDNENAKPKVDNGNAETKVDNGNAEPKVDNVKADEALQENCNSGVSGNGAILDMLNDYSKSGALPFHMPGHKRNVEEFPYLNNISALQDITEINGFDNLHCAKGVLKTSMERASKLWGSLSCRYLASGSTVGVLSAIFATTHRGDKVLIARNCHKSVYNAVELLGLKPIYIMPQKVEGYDIYGSISVKSVEDAFKQNSDIKLVVLTSPTYEGVISNIAEIARVAHSNNAILFVDEAHGAHLDLSPYFTGGAVKAGADIVVQSLHKTLPSLTQTAVLHICTNAVNEVDVDRALAIFETSSPSYILLSSIDGAVKWLEGCANKKFEMYHNRLIKLYKQLDELSILRIFNGFDKNCQSVFLIDMSKINIFTNGAISGVELQNWLRNKYNIELEMATCTSALAMTSVGDSDLNLQSLACALKEIDSQLASLKNSKNSKVNDQSDKQSNSPNDSVKSQSDKQSNNKNNSEKSQNDKQKSIQNTLPKMECFSWQIDREATEIVDINCAKGRISAEYIFAYPPGIPLVVPGEVLAQDNVDFIKNAIANGVNIISSFNNLPNKICVVKKLD